MMVTICRQGAAVAGWAVTALYACWARPPRLIKTSPALSSMAAAIIVQAFSTIARYSLEDEGLSNVAGGHSEGNIQSPVS